MAGRSRGPGFVSGLILGGLMGGGAALIYGRRAELTSWEQLRDRSLELRRQADELAVRAREAIDDLSQHAKLIMEEIRELLLEMTEEGRESAARAMADLQSRMQERVTGAGSPEL
jgi:polyhydroxyalkanoate synthesis regulator phasin